MEKKIPKKHNKDQAKANHREAIKGHRTRKHYIDAVKEEEAQEEINDTRRIPNKGE